MPTDSAGPDEPGSSVVREDKDGNRFSVRRLRADDRDSLQRFYDEFEPKRAAQGLPPKGPERVARWLDAVLPNGIHLVAWRDDELIGHALLVPSGRPDTLEYAVFLRQDVRARGVGTQLNQVAVDAARTGGARRVWLSVEPHNRAAIRSYEKVGFRFLPGTVYSAEAEMALDL